MTVGAISFQPYVYNVNSISPASMNKLSKISDDVLDKKVDYSELAGTENENPLKKGQTLDFQGMLEMQMQRGRYHASRIMKPATEEMSVQDDGTQAETVAVQGDNEAQAKALTMQADHLHRFRKRCVWRMYRQQRRIWETAIQEMISLISVCSRPSALTRCL